MARQRPHQSCEEFGACNLAWAEIDGHTRRERILFPAGNPLGKGIDCPVADRMDQAAFLGTRQKRARQPQAVGWMIPAQQPLDGLHFARRQGNLRLKYGREFVVVERAAELDFELRAPCHPYRERVGIELKLATPARLGMIHGDVGRAHDLRQRRAVFGHQGNADRGAHSDLDTADVDRLHERFEQRRADTRSIVATLDVGQKHGELIAR